MPENHLSVAEKVEIIRIVGENVTAREAARTPPPSLDILTGLE